MLSGFRIASYFGGSKVVLRAIFAPAASIQYVGVPRRRPRVAVPEQFLFSADVVAVF